MKLLLTSAGLSNQSIINSLQKLVGKPFEELNAVFIPTAANVEEGDKDWLINDLEAAKSLNFNSLDIVDIAALQPEWAQKRIEKADVIFVGGGNSFYLSYWLEKSGLFDLLPELLKTRLYVGISAGSMAITANLRVSSTGQLIDEEYDELGPEGQSLAKTAKLVDFVIRPHLNSQWFSKIRIDFLSEVAKQINETMYVLDDDSAVEVDEGNIQVISEGEWKKFN